MPGARKLVFLLLLAPVASSCARFRPNTLAPGRVAPARPGVRVRVDVTVDKASPSGSHHEGVAQIPQPWIWGLADAQRATLTGDIPAILTQAAVEELRSNDFDAVPINAPEVVGEVRAHVAITEVHLNTYGSGFLGFLGSAGDYWDVTLDLREIAVEQDSWNTRTGHGEEIYAKSAPCPARLNVSVIGFATDLARVAAGDMLSMPFLTGADYRLDLNSPSPVVMAGRHLGRRLAEILNGSELAPLPQRVPRDLAGH